MHKNLPSGGESERVGDVRRRMVFVQSVKSALVGRSCGNLMLVNLCSERFEFMEEGCTVWPSAIIR